jgi:hypothetical protein
MELPVVIETLPDQKGFLARTGEPLPLRTQADTADEAVRRAGIRLTSISFPRIPPRGGWLPDDELTQEWLASIEEYRRECDEADRRRILGEDADNEETP